MGASSSSPSPEVRDWCDKLLVDGGKICRRKSDTAFCVSGDGGKAVGLRGDRYLLSKHHDSSVRILRAGANGPAPATMYKWRGFP